MNVHKFSFTTNIILAPEATYQFFKFYVFIYLIS